MSNKTRVCKLCKDPERLKFAINAYNDAVKFIKKNGTKKDKRRIKWLIKPEFANYVKKLKILIVFIEEQKDMQVNVEIVKIKQVDRLEYEKNPK